ncbi:hypothetical protein HY312_00470 [Candidatus Saccharibacteria bacterium]|nr:hypothetical protein [Candidatus Saccharibacteria bacterium]
MNEPQLKSHTTFALPPSVVSKIDISHLATELEALDGVLNAMAIRAKAGMQDQTRPVVSEQLTEFLRLNSLKIEADGQSRIALIKEVRLLKEKAPIIHMTFAVEADKQSLQQLVQWLRTSIHPQAVVRVGLQPGLVAGVYLRTPNHVHDLSLRGMIQSSRGLLVKEIGALRVRS